MEIQFLSSNLYIVYLLKIAKVHIFRHFTIRSDVAEIIIFHRKACFKSILVPLKQCLDMITHSMTIFIFLKKIDFLKFKNWLKNRKLKILRRIRVRIKRSFCSQKLHYRRKYIPTLLSTCILNFDFFLVAPKIQIFERALI